MSNNHDRAAPKGLGAVKAAGNYAADIAPVHQAHGDGYNTTLYLDAKERKFIEEFSVCNFVGITKAWGKKQLRLKSCRAVHGIFHLADLVVVYMYFWNFHHDPWGNDPIWLVAVCSGLFCGFKPLKDGRYVTPKSDTILQSTTNIMLQQLARNRGMIVEERPIDFEKEIENFKEVGIVAAVKDWLVVSNISCFYPYLVKSSHLTNIFQTGWNRQLEDFV